MSVKDVLVLAGPGNEKAGAYALWLCETCGASLTAAAPVVEPPLPTHIAAEMPKGFLAQLMEEAEAAADMALSDFTAKAQLSPVPLETQKFDAPAVDIASAVSSLARCFDLTVLQQSDPEGPDGREVIEATLFGSGRPILVIPYIHQRPALGKVLIAWDGGTRSARAVGDALPLLSFAREVEIVGIQRDRDDARSTHLAGRLSRHLGRHGIAAMRKTIAAGSIDVANMLLSYATDAGADMIVMGGYGHSRLRETVLGGTTREILQSMTVPVLMSH
jgi:nucleotide-binding universal stress UspA family protein